MDILQQTQKVKLDCSKHPDEEVQYIQFQDIQKDKHLFYCQFCQDEDQQYKSSNYILLKKISQSNEKQFLDKWPPLEDNSIHNKIQQCLKQSKQSQLSERIESFFVNLEREIIQTISETKKKMINLSNSFPHNSDNILDKFKEISQISQLKQVLFDCKIDSNEKENKYREMILDVESKKSSNSQTMNILLEQYEQNQNLIDFATPDKIKSSIIQMINKINIFTLDNNIIDTINNLQKESSSQFNTDLIFDLISTKSNYCSENFLTSIKSLLNQFSPLIEKIPFSEVFIKEQIDFSYLNNHYLDQINDFSKHFSRLSNQLEEYMNEMKNKPIIKQIMSVLKLKSNYLKQDFLVEFEKYLIESFPLLTKNIKLDTIFEENQKILTLQELSDATLNDMIELIQKINELQKNNKTHEQIQRIKLISSYLKKMEYKQDDLEKLLYKYPIFDLLDPNNQTDILPQIQMIKTDYAKSQQALQIVKNKQDNQISISQNISGYTNCVSDFILDQNTNYVFRFQFQTNSQSAIMLGLINDSQKDSNGYSQNMSCYFYIDDNYFYSGGYGIDKKEKGDFSVLKGDQSMIEMRVNLKNEILQILDYPNYYHILSLKDEFKNKLKKQDLRLYVGQLYENKSVLLVQAFKKQ